MKILKKLMAIAVMFSILTGTFVTANALSLITGNESENVEYFKLHQSAENGNIIKNEDGKLVFDFTAKSSEGVRTSYIERQNLMIEESFCFDAFVRFGDISKAKGAILFRNYYVDTNKYYYMITFDSGKMKFAADSKDYDIPNDEFRIKIVVNGNAIAFEVDGQRVSAGSFSSSFSLEPNVAFRAEFDDSLCSGGESHFIHMDNIKLMIDENSDGICADDAEFYVDYGRERIREELVLDPFESLTAKIRVANLSNESKAVMFVDRENIAINKALLSPGEVKTLSLVRSDGSVTANNRKDYLLWTDDGTITPLKPKQTIANDGVVIPAIAECRQMLADLESGNLWLTDEHIAQMKSWLDSDSDTYDEAFDKIWQDIVDEGESLLEEAPIDYGTALGVQPAGKIYYRIALWSTLYRVTQDERYAERICEEMENAAAFPDWHDEHFLDTAAVLCGMAIGYDTLNTYLEDVQTKSSMADAIYKMGLSPALEIYRTGTDTWDTRETNWNVICNSAVAMATLSLGADDSYPDECAEALNTAMRNLRIALSKFTVSGSWYEGVSYAGYMMTYAIDLFGMLTNAFATSFGYDRMPNLLNYGDSIIAQCGVYSYNHDDCEREEAGSSPRFLWLAKKNGDYALGRLHLDYLAENSATFRDVILYDPVFKTGDISAIKNDFYDPELKIVSFRDDFENNTYLAFNAGSNLSSHSHLDMGSFVYDWGGARWFEDLGIDNYDLWHYLDYNAYKWYYYRNRAEGHNCVVFDTCRFDGTPATAPDQVVDAVGEITQFHSSDDISYAVMDISSAYASECSAFERSLFLDKESGAMAVRDNYELTSDSATAYWFAHTQADIELADDGNAAVLTQNVNGVEKKLYVKMVGGDGKFISMDALPLASSPNPDTLADNVAAGLTQSKNTDFKKLAVKIDITKGSHGLFVLAIPYENKEQLDDIIERFISFH